MSKYVHYIITVCCLAVGVVTFISMFDQVSDHSVIAFEIFGILALILTANLSSFITRHVMKRQRWGLPFILITGALLVIALWFVVMFYILH